MPSGNRGERKYHRESHPEDQKPCREGDFTATAVRPVIHRALLADGKPLLACEKLGQEKENGGVKAEMVIRKRNNIFRTTLSRRGLK